MRTVLGARVLGSLAGPTVSRRRRSRMGLRTFIDSTGREWSAFDVVPRDSERRQRDRRSPPPERESGGAFDDRRETDRRMTIGSQSMLASQEPEGWLCFERGVDRRRLTPIPNDWERCPDSQLESYCSQAKPVHRLFASPDQFAERRR
jgi:hypothetical protein